MTRLRAAGCLRQPDALQDGAGATAGFSSGRGRRLRPKAGVGGAKGAFPAKLKSLLPALLRPYFVEETLEFYPLLTGFA